MRISKEQAQANHDRVVDAASVLIRERGIEGAGVAEVMKAAGLTHGGFYNHFPSKEALTVEALGQGFREMSDERAKASSLAVLLKGYLSEAARRNPGKACPAAGLAGDVARQPDAVKSEFADGLDEIVGSIATRLVKEHGRGEGEARSQAVALFTRMVGATMLARAMPETDPRGSEILSLALRACLDEIEAA